MVDWRDFLTLDDGEYIVHSWASSDGVLALTNQRLANLKADRGLLPRYYEVVKSIPLESIKGIQRKGGFFMPNICIRTDEGKHIFRNFASIDSNGQIDFFNKSVVGHFKEKVMEQIKERKQELERKRMAVIVDFSFLKTFIEKGGIIMTTLRCPHCSAPIKMPEKGTETICEHCESTVYARDLFEKVKKLLE